MIKNIYRGLTFIVLIMLSFFGYFNFTNALNLTPIFLNKIEKKTTLYLIKDTDGKYKFIKSNDPLIKAHPNILSSDRIKYNIFENYPWITNGDVNFGYSIKNSEKNAQIEITGQKINKKNIFNNFYYTYPLIDNDFSNLTTDGTKTYIRDNDDDDNDKNKDQYPNFINKDLLDNYGKFTNLFGNYNDNFFAGDNNAKITKEIYYYDIDTDKVKQIDDGIRIIFSDNFNIILEYDSNNNNIVGYESDTNCTAKIYDTMYYKDKNTGNLKRMNKKQLFDIINNGYLYSPKKYIKTGNELKGFYMQQSISKKSYNILPGAPLISVTQLKVGDNSANLYYNKWKDLFHYILGKIDNKISDVNVGSETNFVRFSKELPTLLFGSDNSYNNDDIKQKEVSFNKSYQYKYKDSNNNDVNITLKKDIYSILNKYGYNFLTQGNIKPIYWTLKYGGLTLTNPASLSHNIFYVDKYNKDVYVNIGMLGFNNNFIGSTGGFVDAYKIHNNETKGMKNGYSQKIKGNIYNITFPAVVSNIDIANQCSGVIIEGIKNGNAIKECELKLGGDGIKINKLMSNGNISPNINTFDKIKIKIKIIKQSYDDEYKGIMYYINFGRVKLNDIKDVTLLGTDNNGNSTTYTFESHVFANKLLPGLRDTEINNDTIGYLIRNNYYSRDFSNKRIEGLIGGHSGDVITGLYGYPIFIRGDKTTSDVNIKWNSPLDELYHDDKLKISGDEIPFWVNLNSNILVDNFIKTDVLGDKNKGIYHDIMFYSKSIESDGSRINLSYRFNGNQKIDEEDFLQTIDNGEFTKELDGYNYNNIETFYPYSANDNATLKTYNQLLKNILLYNNSKGSVNYYGLSGVLGVPDANKYYKIINNYIFSEIINNELKNYYEGNGETYNPLIFFKRIFSYGYLELSYLNNIVDNLYLISQNINVLQSQRHINIKQLYNGSEKNKSMPVSYGDDLYKFNNIEDFSIIDYQNISSISNISSILEKQIATNGRTKRNLYYGWLEHDLDDHNSNMDTQSSIGYNVLMTNGNIYPFLNTLVYYSSVPTNSEILTNPKILDRKIKVITKGSNGDNFGGSGLNGNNYTYNPYYNAIEQIEKRSNNIADLIVDGNIDNYFKLIPNGLYANKLSIVNSYIWEGTDTDGNYVSSVSNSRINYDENLKLSDKDKKQLYLYKNLPLNFLYTTGGNTTNIAIQGIEKKAHLPAFGYNYNGDKGIIENKGDTKVNVLEFDSDSDFTDFQNTLNNIYNKIYIKEIKMLDKTKEDCKDLSITDKRNCLLNKIKNSSDKTDSYFISKGTTDPEIDLRTLLRNKQLNPSDLNAFSSDDTTCDTYVMTTMPSILVPKYIPSKDDTSSIAKGKLMLVQEGLAPFNNNGSPSLIKCSLNNGKILLIANDILLPADDNNEVYLIPENSDVYSIVNNPLKGISANKKLAEIVVNGIINKIFWAAGDKEMYDMSKIMFNKFDNSNINGIYYQILNNFEGNFDTVDKNININFNINDLVANTFYDENLNAIPYFNPDENKTYYMSLISAKKYSIGTTTVVPKLYKDNDNWIYDYMDLFGKFGEGNVNNIDKFFNDTKSVVVDKMINDTAGDSTKNILKPAVLKLLSIIKKDLEVENNGLIINSINAVILDKDDFHDLYNAQLNPGTMFLIIDIDINDLDNGNKHLIIPYILTWGTIMKDYIDNKYIEYIPYKFDIIPDKTNIFNFGNRTLKNIVDSSGIDCVNNICVWNYSDRFKGNADGKYYLSSMVTITSNYNGTIKGNALKDDNGVAAFDFFVKKDTSDTQLEVPYNFDNTNGYNYDSNSEKVRYKELNKKNNLIDPKTFKDKELAKILQQFYKTFNFVYYKINYDSANVKINVDPNSNYKLPYTIKDNKYNDNNNSINEGFIDNKIRSSDKNIYKKDVVNTIFDKYNSNGFDYKQNVIDNGNIKGLVFSVDDKIYNFVVSNNKKGNLKDYINDVVYNNKDKGLEGKMDGNYVNNLKHYFSKTDKAFDINNYMGFFNTLYIPFSNEKPIICQAVNVYTNEDNPVDKAILNNIYTTINVNNGIVTINGQDYDGQITNSIETLDNGEHKIKIYIKNIDTNDCDKITLKKIYISSTNLDENGSLIIDGNTRNIKTNDIVDISSSNIEINKGDYKEIEIDVKDVNISNYDNPTINISISYTQATSVTKLKTNEIKLEFKGKPLNNSSICSQVKCSLIKVTPTTDLIDLTRDSHTNIKYQLQCNNNYNKDIDKIDYTIKYTNNYIYPSYIKLDSNNSFNNSIYKLKKGQTIKGYGTSDNYNIIDDKLFIINSIQNINLNFSTTIEGTYNITFEDNTTESCNLNQILYKSNLDESNNQGGTGSGTNGNHLKNYTECYITDKSDNYNIIPYDIQGFLNDNSSNNSFIQNGYLYLKFYKLQQNDQSGNVGNYPTYRFQSSNIVKEENGWWDDSYGGNIGEYNKIIYKAKVTLPSYINLTESELVDRIKNQQVKIFNKKENLGHYLNSYYLKVEKEFGTLSTNSNGQNYCDYNSLTTKTTTYHGPNDQYSSGNKYTNAQDNTEKTSNCLYKTNVEIYLYLNTELYGLDNNHETPRIDSQKVYSITDTSDYNNKKAGYVIATQSNRYNAEQIFKNNPYSFFDQILDKQDVSSKPFVELWLPISITKPENTSSTNLENKISGNQLLSNNPIVCESSLEYQKLGYKWVDTSNKTFPQNLYIAAHTECSKYSCWCVHDITGYGSVGKRVNLDGYGLNENTRDEAPIYGNCYDTWYKLQSGVNVPPSTDNTKNGKDGSRELEGNQNYQIVLKQVGSYYNIQDTPVKYVFYPTILAKGWTQYVGVYDINKAESKNYNFMNSSNKSKEVYGSVITNNSGLDITNTSKITNNGINYILPLNNCYELVDNRIVDLTNVYQPDERGYCKGGYKPLFYSLITDEKYNQKYIDENIITTFNNNGLLEFPEDKFMLYIYNAADNNTNQLYIGASNNVNLKIKNTGGIFLTNDIEDLSDQNIKVNITGNIIKNTNDRLEKDGTVKSNDLTLFVNGDLYIGKNVSLIQANIITTGNIIVEDSNVPLTIQGYMYVKGSLINKRKQVSIADTDELTGINKPSVRVMEDPVFQLLDLPFKDKLIYLEKDF